MRRKKVLELVINLPFFFGKGVREIIEEICKKLEIGEEDSYALKNAIDEIYTNVFEHAYKKKPGRIVIRLYQSNKRLTISIKDWGERYNFSSQGYVDLKEKIEKGEIRGLGLSLTHKLVDRLSYKSSKKVNEHIIVKECKEGKC